MSAADLQALLPLLIVAGTAVMVMLAIAVHRQHAVSAALTFAGLAVAMATVPVAHRAVPHNIPPLFLIDNYALFYIVLVLGASLVFVPLAYDYFHRSGGEHHDELYVLMLVATLGSSVLTASSHLVSLFLGLELLSVPLYAMIAYLQKRPLPLEAGMKYLVLAALSAAFLLFGIALIYSALGTMDFAQIVATVAAGSQSETLIVSGLVLIVTGLGFKLAAVPFHFWAPDVYEGAPAPVTAYLATVSKGAIFAVLLRLFRGFPLASIPSVWLLFAAIAVASMAIGNLLALLQPNLKRLLAYSSVAHIGYLLVAFRAGGDLGPVAVSFYLAAYFITTLGAFGVISVLSSGEKEFATIEDYRGLFWRRPFLASVFTAMLLSLAGIPLTAGFIAKFYVVAAGASRDIWTLVIVMVVASAIGLYYYLRVIVTMYARVEKLDISEPRSEPIPNLLLFALTAMLLWFGIVPAPVLRMIQTAIAS